jgi:hypothetical protein
MIEQSYWYNGEELPGYLKLWEVADLMSNTKEKAPVIRLYFQSMSDSKRDYAVLTDCLTKHISQSAFDDLRSDIFEQGLILRKQKLTGLESMMLQDYARGVFKADISEYVLDARDIEDTYFRLFQEAV